MHLYIYGKEKHLFKTYNLFGKKTSVYIMPPERSIDIDSSFDFKLVKHLLGMNYIEKNSNI